MALKIYTKTGDKGSTGLIGGTRVPKHHIRIESYGTVDELNSHLGLIKDLLLSESDIHPVLQEVQDRLFTIGSSLACDPEKEPGFAIPDLKPTDISLLEQEIDRMNAAIPPMRFFVLPGGHTTLSQIHIARCVCRRAERRCVELDLTGGQIERQVIIYLNRLSDYIFVLSRYMAHRLGVEEIPWKPRV